MPDFGKTPPETIKVFLECRQRILLAIDRALYHMVIEHSTAPIYRMDTPVVEVSGPLCDDGIVLLCGKAVFEKILTEQTAAQETLAAATTQALLDKVKNA